MKKNPNQDDPREPDYWEEARDSVINLVPFYDPNHHGEIVRGKIFHKIVNELKLRVEVERKNNPECDKLHPQ